MEWTNTLTSKDKRLSSRVNVMVRVVLDEVPPDFFLGGRNLFGHMKQQDQARIGGPFAAIDNNVRQQRIARHLNLEVANVDALTE